MHIDNIIVSIAMVLIGYAVFVFIAGSYNPFNTPAKSTSDDGKRRSTHILGLIAGCLVTLSCLAAWFTSSEGIVQGLKTSIITATVSLLLLLVGDWFRGLFNKPNELATPDSAPSIEDPLDSIVEMQNKHEEQLESKLQEHKLIVQEKSETISTLENTIIQLQNDTATLTEKANRLDEAEVELQTVRQELSAQKTRDQESLDLSEKAIEALQAEKLNLQHEVELTQKQKQELEYNHAELVKLQSDNERNTQITSVLEEKEEELDVLRQTLEEKDSVVNKLNHELDSKNNELITANQKLESKANELNDLSQQIRSKDYELNSLIQQLDSKNEKFNALSREMQMKDNAHEELVRELRAEKEQIRKSVPDLAKLKKALASSERTSNDLQNRLQRAALREREGRLKMEASAKRAVSIARKAVGKLHEHEKRLAK